MVVRAVVRFGCRGGGGGTYGSVAADCESSRLPSATHAVSTRSRSKLSDGVVSVACNLSMACNLQSKDHSRLTAPARNTYRCPSALARDSSPGRAGTLTYSR
jgi:hypothetical protein